MKLVILAIFSVFTLFSTDIAVTQSAINKHEIWVTSSLDIKTAKITLIGPDGAEVGSSIVNERNGLITAIIALKDPIKAGEYTALVENKQKGVKQVKTVLIKQE